MCLECKQLFALTKMAACHGGIQPSLKLSKHWIETSLRTLKKQLFEFVSLAGLDKMIFVISILFSPSPSSNEQAVTYAGYLCMKNYFDDFFPPGFKESKKIAFYLKPWMMTPDTVYTHGEIWGTLMQSYKAPSSKEMEVTLRHDKKRFYFKLHPTPKRGLLFCTTCIYH